MTAKFEHFPAPGKSVLYLVVVLLITAVMGASILASDLVEAQSALLSLLILAGGLAGVALSVNHFRLFTFCFLVLVPLTRQLPYRHLFSYGGTALFVVLYVSRKMLLKSGWRKLNALVLCAVGAYLIVVLVSSLGSEYRDVGLVQLVREVGFFIVVYLLYDYLRSRRRWETAVKAVIWCGIFASVFVVLSGMQSLLTGRPMLGTQHRIAGIFVNPSAAGLAISLCFPVTISYFQWTGHIGLRYHRLRIVIVTALAVIATVLTVSRISILGVLLSILLLNWEWLRRHKIAIFIAGFLVLFAVASFALAGSATRQQINAILRVDRGLSGRDFLWERAWAIFLEHPIFGTGPSTFRYYVLPPSQMARFVSADNLIRMHLADEIIPTYGWYPPGVFGGVIGNSAHNIWLNTAATTGTLGVLAVFMLFAVYWHTARQRMHKLRWAIDQRYRYVVRGCMVGLVAFFVRTQFEEPGMLRGAIAENLLFWLTFVIVLTSQNLVKPTLVEVSNEV